MKWMRLKTYLLPSVMQEIDSVIEQYLSNKKQSNILKN